MPSAASEWLSDFWLSLSRRLGRAPTNYSHPSTAFHEAGHALAAHLLGRPCVLATVRPTDQWLGRVVHRRAPVVSIDPRMSLEKRRRFTQQLHRNVMSSALISLAGEAAEALWSGADPRTHAARTFDLSISDFDRAEYALALLWHLLSEGRDRPSARERRNAVINGVCKAHELLAPNQPALTAVATALLRVETLQESRLARTIQRHLTAPHVARDLDPRTLFVRPT